MTDRGQAALRQSRDTLEVGPSAFHWDGDTLVIRVRERAVPLGGLVEGTVRVHPAAVTGVEVALDETGRHVWRPFAPTAEIEVDLGPGWRWRGHGYFDANFGTAALEADFSYWTWGRFPTRHGATCFYDATRRDGSPDLSVALAFARDGSLREVAPPPKARLARSLWAVRRETRADAGFAPRQTRRMLDAPFYCRSGVETRIDGEVTEGVHEALDLDRFASPWLKPMLAVKVPRRAGWRV